jgi:3-oxoacyl-[acyl-carrier-protein] synthase-3
VLAIAYQEKPLLIYFSTNMFLDEKGILLKDDNFLLSEKLQKITGIEEEKIRR